MKRVVSRKTIYYSAGTRS